MEQEVHPDEKHHIHRAYTNDPSSVSKKNAFCNIKKTVQRELRQMQDKWLSEKADEIQFFADCNDMKNFYKTLNSLYGPTTSGSSPLLSEDGSTSITDKEKILERSAEHFKGVLNRPSHINENAIAHLP